MQSYKYFFLILSTDFDILYLRNYTIKRQSQGIYTAFNTDLLSNTIAKIWDGMEFLNTSTRGGMKRLRMVKNTAEVRRAS
jgi:hypothetical protein